MDECFIFLAAAETLDPNSDRIFVEVGVSYTPDLQLKRLQAGSPLRLKLYACFRLPSQIFAQRVEHCFNMTSKPWAGEGGWSKHVPTAAVDELASRCVEEWINDGPRAIDIAMFCDRAGIPCHAFACQIAEFIKHPTLTDETP